MVVSVWILTNVVISRINAFGSCEPSLGDKGGCDPQLSCMMKFPALPHIMFVSLWRNRDLIWQLTKRDVMGRYRGSMMGLLWSLFNPILMLAVYTFVFSVVFQARWGGGEHTSKAEFALILFAGLITFNLFSDK